MRITSVHLKNYKRFTNLRINDIPQSARLVVLVGPNGSGKSSVFDAFLLKSQPEKYNWALTDGIYEGYLLKDEATSNHPSSTQEVARDIQVELDEAVNEWSRAFLIRSSYRNEADFSDTNLGPVESDHEFLRFRRIIDQDEAVKDNFNRLGRGALYGALRGHPDEESLSQFRSDTLGELQAALSNLFVRIHHLACKIWVRVSTLVPSDLKRALLKTSTTKTYLVERRQHSIYSWIFSSSETSTKMPYIA